MLCPSPMSHMIRLFRQKSLFASAGTCSPLCAIKESNPTVEATVLPPVFGPVMTTPCIHTRTQSRAALQYPGQARDAWRFLCNLPVCLIFDRSSFHGHAELPFGKQEVQCFHGFILSLMACRLSLIKAVRAYSIRLTSLSSSICSWFSSACSRATDAGSIKQVLPVLDIR